MRLTVRSLTGARASDKGTLSVRTFCICVSVEWKREREEKEERKRRKRRERDGGKRETFKLRIKLQEV